MTQMCSTCRTEKPLIEDYFYKNNTKRGFQRQCKPCHSNYMKNWSLENRERLRYQRVLSTYNLTREEYDDLLLGQGDCCAICQQELIDPCVDHDPLTDKVRGILCRQCNVGLGNFKDNIGNLEGAIHYLKSQESGPKGTTPKEQ